jgi:hypothetical protein
MCNVHDDEQRYDMNNITDILIGHITYTDSMNEGIISTIIQALLDPAPIAVFALLEAGVSPASPIEYHQRVGMAEVVEEYMTAEEAGAQRDQSLVVGVISHRKTMTVRID